MSKISIKDLINQKYGRLTIIKEVEPYILPCEQKKRKMLCRCDCGNFKEVLLSSLKNGNTQSCGCLQKELMKKRMTTHGLTNHPLYRIWASMKERCCNFNHKYYKDYGKRGIKVCSKWINNPEKFIKWALVNGWKKDLEIDRINNDDSYKPDNIRFVTRAVNNRNTRLLMSTNTSGYRGVSWCKQTKKWMACISINKKTKNFGYFDRSKLAALRYNVEAFLLNDGRPLNFE